MHFNVSTSSTATLSDMPPKMNLVLGLKNFLEDLFGAPVDLIRRHKNLRPIFLARIERDAIYVIR